MQSTKEVVSLSVTPTGYSMFQELATQLNLLHNTLALPLFEQAWKNLASQFDQVRYKLKNYFRFKYIKYLCKYKFFIIVSSRRSRSSKPF